MINHWYLQLQEVNSSKIGHQEHLIQCQRIFEKRNNAFIDIQQCPQRSVEMVPLFTLRLPPQPRGHVL